MKGGKQLALNLSGIFFSIVAPVVLMFSLVVPGVLILLCSDIFNSISPSIAIKNLPTPPGSPLHFRDVAELASFCATAIVPLVAVIAGWVAFRQFQAAETTRLVSVYMAISEKWEADGIARARRHLFQYDTFWEKHRAQLSAFQTSAHYIHAVLLDTGEEAKLLFRDYVVLMSYLEDIGLMCSKGYLSKSDVSNFMGNAIVSVIALLIPQIEYERRGIADPVIRGAYYANALRLYEDLQKSKPTTITGFGA